MMHVLRVNIVECMFNSHGRKPFEFDCSRDVYVKDSK